MFTITCQKCHRTTSPVYKTVESLPLDWDAGFLCLHCTSRLDANDLIAGLIGKVDALEKALDTKVTKEPTRDLISTRWRNNGSH